MPEKNLTLPGGLLLSTKKGTANPVARQTSCPFPGSQRMELVTLPQRGAQRDYQPVKTHLLKAIDFGM